MTKKGIKFDLSITPLRVVVILVSLALSGLNEFYSWGLPNTVFILAVVGVVFLTQPKQVK